MPLIKIVILRMKITMKIRIVVSQNTNGSEHKLKKYS